LTHGGFEKLSRRFSDYGIHAQFTEEDILHILKLTTYISTAAAVPLLGELGKTQKANDLQEFHATTFGWSRADPTPD
jgi:hypothetical protein